MFSLPFYFINTMWQACSMFCMIFSFSIILNFFSYDSMKDVNNIVTVKHHCLFSPHFENFMSLLSSVFFPYIHLIYIKYMHTEWAFLGISLPVCCKPWQLCDGRLHCQGRHPVVKISTGPTHRTPLIFCFIASFASLSIVVGFFNTA